MWRRGLLAIAAACCAVGPAFAASKPATATPYDGFTFRARAVPTVRPSSGWNNDVVCANGVRNGLTEKTIRTITPATLAPATAASDALSAVLRITYDGDRVVALQGSAQLVGGGVDQQLNFDVTQESLKPTCAGFPKVGTSAAGQVYSMSWNDQVCDNTPCSRSHTSINGSGCFAVTQQGGELVATIQIGTCKPSAFPSVPSLDTVAVKRGLLDGLLLRVTARSGAYTFRNDCGRQLFLNPYSTWTQVVRPLAGLRVSGGSQLQIIPLIFNGNGNARNWGGALSLGLARHTAADSVRQDFTLTDFPGAKTPAGWGCRAASAHDQPLDTALPVYVWAGKNRETYVGRAWIRVLGKDGQTADSHTGGAWSALIAFGAKDFSGG